jgi:hypothetical protein
VPEILSQFVGVAFSPFSVPKRRPHQMVPDEDRVSFRILSIVEYRGREGRLLISTVRPSPAALRPGLDLGHPVGSLSDGSPIFQMIGEGGLLYQVRWLKEEHVVAMTSDLPVRRLVMLAENVILL